MKISVVKDEDRWLTAFVVERQLLQGALGSVARRIHHIGSTAVVGLAAKPVIDIMMEVDSLSSLDELKDNVESLGYEAMGEFGIAGRRYYRKGGNHRTHQIHAFAAGDANLVRHLAFRDYLREHASVRQAYQDLKVRIASTCGDDIDAYCEAKDPFIKRHEALALEWYRERADALRASLDLGEIPIRRIGMGEGALFRDLRLAALQDAPYAFGSTYESAKERSLESWEEQADGTAQGPNRATFLAFDQNRPVGITAVYRDRERKDVAELLQVWVAPEARGTGLAKQLMEVALEWTLQNDYGVLIARVTKNNERALAFYLQQGFLRVGETETEIVTQKRIR